MSDIGPELPPHLLAKRKRKQEEAAEAAPTTASGANQPASPGGGEKRRRVMGPAMPPAPLDERPTEPPKVPEDSDSDDDDGYGPALPSGPTEANDVDTNDGPGYLNHSDSKQAPEEKPKRDDWMMMPPKQDDLAARMDPSKQRARGFNTGKGAKAPQAGGEDSSSWYETAEQKQKRLAHEMMGTSKPSTVGPSGPSQAPDAAKDEAAAKKIRQHTEKTRGPSLMDQHTKTTGPDADDDPSKRAFDREKDMGSGMRIGQTQRKEMMNKASGFSSKFSGGSYL
ncbi:uncharacterized protein LTR77_003943 [Saxophila tyrrhenica]|uniref:DUF3752 domain-containing protein n=1 Tax=Saxophila tyrrhenica TaxID=1690608 RepID=A0AAV9PF16_9PEZI|nr:hypothetical protein LTR77_003943 [Saxophila tyrrhenica]